MGEELLFKTATKLVQLSNAVTYYKNLKMKSLGLTSTQSDTIRVILHNPGMTAARLKEQMHLSQSTVSGILARLEKKGLIEKGSDADDGRKAILIPTKRCLDLEKSLIKTAVETQEFITDGMDEKEKKEFDRLLQIALDNLNSVRGRNYAERK